MSCELYHGPTAQGRVAEAASTWGRVVGVFGDPRNGLNIATMREAVAAMESPPVGDRPGTLVIGPVDVLTQEGIVDVLLKSIEEIPPHAARPYLWAWDAGSVRTTILSRCLLFWCPGQVTFDRKLVEAARSLVDSAANGSKAGVIEALGDVQEDWKEDGDDFLRAVAAELRRRPEKDVLKLWPRIRPLMRQFQTPPYHEVLAGILP